MKTVGYGLGLHSYNDHYDWCLQNGCRPGPFGGMVFNTGTTTTRKPTKNQLVSRAKLKLIQRQIYPDRGCRLRKSELGDQLPPNVIIAESIDADLDHKAIQPALAALVAKEIADERKAEEADQAMSDLTLNTRARQRTELGKVSTFHARTIDLLAEGNSVVMFLNYTESLEAISAMLTADKVEHFKIVGGMTKGQRDAVVDGFKANERRVCLVQIDAGAASIDLDDVTGEAPRCTLVSPCYSAKKLIQALGRVHRTTTVSKVMQWILYASEGVEERVCRIVQHKLNNISLLNDSVLSEIIIDI
jgi:superfamily II DNA or RNA helicase